MDALLSFRKWVFTTLDFDAAAFSFAFQMG
jgi:hypothetical protein